MISSGEQQSLSPDEVSDETLYNFPHIPFSEIGNYPNGLKDIQDRKTDGFLIRGVLTPAEADSIVNNLSKVDDSHLEKTRSGQNYPYAFASVKNLNAPAVVLDDYFVKARHYRENFVKIFNVDFESRVKQVFETMGGGRLADVPREPNQNVTFSPAQLRVMFPDKGGIFLHCGKYFQDQHSGFYSYLDDVSLVDEQISFFLMLQPPDKGGELTIFDIEYTEAKQKLEEWDNKNLITDSGAFIDMENPKDMPRRKLRPGKGDMIIFDGGNIWHQVENPKGTKSRITLGGFITFSHDDKKIYYWG